MGGNAGYVRNFPRYHVRLVLMTAIRTWRRMFIAAAPVGRGVALGKGKSGSRRVE